MERLVLWHRTLPPPFEETGDSAASADWIAHVVEGVQEASGVVLSSLGGTVVGEFDAHRLEGVVHLALRLLEETEQGAVPGGRPTIAFGVATGDVQTGVDALGHRASTGTAIDRAQLLANQAGAGELVLDVETREAASRTFVFGRAVSTSTFALRGETVDRKRPLRLDCRMSIRELLPPHIAPSMRAALAPIASAASGDQTRVFALYGAAGSEGHDGLERLVASANPPLWLQLGAVPGGLEPLGSIRLGLLKQWVTPEGLRRAVDPVDPTAAQTLEEIASANPPTRARAVSALRALLQMHRTEHGMPWIYLDRVAAIDRASLSVLESALKDESVNALVAFRTTDGDVHVPHFASLDGETIQLPRMTPDEAATVAASILGESAQSELARQVAVTGGDTTRGIVEAARTLVAAGDLVSDGARFVWRRGPRGGAKVNLRTLVEERVAVLEEDALRALETVCAAIPASCREVIEAAMEADGLSLERRAKALEILQRERFMTASLRPDSETLRRVVIQRMPAARRAEVYRFVGTAIQDVEPYAGPALAGTVGAYLCEGGDVNRGVRALLEAGVVAATQGYTRSAVRLAAIAVQFQPDRGTRSLASQISRSAQTDERVLTQAEEDPGLAIAPTEPPPGPAQNILESLRAGHHETFDGLIETAIAEGANLTVANCLRTVSYGSRGDLADAERSLNQARKHADTASPTAIRLELTTSWLLLAQGRIDDATMHSIDAIALSKEAEDSHGKAAAFRMLALCCWAANRGVEAEQLERAAAQVHI